ncbi:putative quinol monooxygenase [Luteolibacter algae]|uniref:Quinol monooxygenase n=1 Tax=Luteolibacter algae TaxID=454151 RepID=A0ABW5D784_9BACT
MSKKLTITADIYAKPDRIDLVKAELLKLVEVTRAEDGCLQYDLHQDNVDPTHFFFHENWESRAHWEAHMENAHLAAYQTATEGAVADFKVNELTHIA